MKTIDEKEQNLFNATDTLAQFYGEIETFMSIFTNCMEKNGYSLKAERLRPGTMYIKNLTRRLLGSAMVLYAKGAGMEDEGLEDEDIEDVESEELEDGEVSLSESAKIPFAMVWLFGGHSIPTADSLNSPLFITGTLGNFSFFDKKSDELTRLDDPVLSINNLVQVRVKPSQKVHDKILQNCWKPKRMKRYRLEAELLNLTSYRLLEIDSQEKIRNIAQELAARCEPKDIQVSTL